MRTFSYYDYRDFAPLAVKVEDSVNGYSGTTALNKIKDILGEDKVLPFFLACIAYWGQTEYFDGRNRTAVFFSRAIVENFPSLADESNYDEDTIKNAFGFTMSAHRYLQNELFRVIEKYLATESHEISHWLDENDLVLTDNKAIPYKEYLATR